jgi:two-component system response regulator RegA
MNGMSCSATLALDRSLLIVDSERGFKGRFAYHMEHRGYTVDIAETIIDALFIIEKRSPAFAVIDLKLDDGSGLDLLGKLLQKKPDTRAIIVTNYGSFSSAVSAIKLGAIDFLPKTSDINSIERALYSSVGPPEVLQSMQPLTPNRVRWEYIQRTYEQYGRNVSETARGLNMHRRTLQRMLLKHTPH